MAGTTRESVVREAFKDLLKGMGRSHDLTFVPEYEIEIKFKRGYPQDNIVFEDTQTAVLIKNSGEVMRCSVDDVAMLEKLLSLFFRRERREIAEYVTRLEVAIA